VTLDELKTEKALGKLADEFRAEIMRLKGRARSVQKIEKSAGHGVP